MQRLAIIGCVVLILAQSCGPVENRQLARLSPTLPVEIASPGTSGVVIEPTRVQATTVIPSTLPSPTPTSTATIITSTSTPTLTACMQAGGRVEVKEFSTVLLPNPLVYRIYLPPCYDAEQERSYPVLYLIHGQTYTDTQWDLLGAPETADKLIAMGETAPFIIVMPRDRAWLEPTEDKFGLAIEQSLIPWVDEHYRTIGDRRYRAIGGLSRGGAWAIHLGLSHPELFSAVGSHNGYVFYSDVQAVHLWLYNIPEGLSPRMYMDIASSDQPEIIESSTWLEELLTRYDIPHEWHIFNGEHDEAYWKAHVEDYLLWYALEW